MILLLVVAGFALLAAGTYRQSKVAFGRLPAEPVRRAILAGGYAVLGLSLVPVIAGADAGRQLVQWVGLLSVGALAMLIGFWIRAPR